MKKEWQEALWKEYLAESDYLKDKAEQLEEMGKQGGQRIRSHV